MKTVPLHGKIAAGRVALVDDDDYAFVMLYRWYVWELARPGRRPMGPYAVTNYLKGSGKSGSIRMHALIMEATWVDHINHDGLDNQRSNLRLSTQAQNNCNTRPRLQGTSQFKGVSWHSETGRWVASVSSKGRRSFSGLFDSELEAAYAYDAEARKEFGQFAYTNFDHEPTQEMREGWAKATAALSAQRKDNKANAIRRWWDERETLTYICELCGASYESKATVTHYCSSYCCKKAHAERRERQRREGEHDPQAELLF